MTLSGQNEWMPHPPDMPHDVDHESPGELPWSPAPASSHLLAACDDSGETLRVGRFNI